VVLVLRAQREVRC